MTEILTESFCERCGTRYTFESARPKTRLKNVKVLSRGFKNFVMSDDTSMDEAMAAARSETDRELTAHQLDAFHKTFNFCMSCRQYTCPNCWNEVENRCLSCAPHLGHEVMPAAFPDLPSGPLVSDETLYTNGTPFGSNASPFGSTGTNGTNGTDHPSELIGMAEVQARHDEEVDAAARLAALTAPVADNPPTPEVAPEPPIAASAAVEEAPVAPTIDTPAVEPPVAAAAAAAAAVEPPVAAADIAAGDHTASPYDDVEATTPSWLAKLVAVNQVDEAVEARATPPAPVAPAPVAPAPATPAPATPAPVAPAPGTPAPVAPARVAPTPPPAALEPARAAPSVALPPAPEPVIANAPEPLVAATLPEPIVETAVEPPAPAPVVPAGPISIAPAPAPTVEPAAAAAAAGLAAATIHDDKDGEPVEDKTAAQTSGLMERLRPAATMAAAAAISPDPVVPHAPAPATPPVARPGAAVPPPASPTPQPPAPVTPPAAAEPAPSWVPSAPEPTELPAAATAGPPPATRDDVVSQPVWQMVAPDDAPPAADTVQAPTPGPVVRPEPQWPTQPEWPSATATPTGLPFLGRPAQPTGGLDALWAESTREVSRQATGNRAAGGVQPCVSCGLSLSANARFCRRCGAAQGA